MNGQGAIGNKQIGKGQISKPVSCPFLFFALIAYCLLSIALIAHCPYCPLSLLPIVLIGLLSSPYLGPAHALVVKTGLFHLIHIV